MGFCKRTHDEWDSRQCHIWYCAYILNLIVKYELEVIKNGIERIGEGVLYWKTSPKKRKSLMKNLSCSNSYNQKNGFDCPMRWDSTPLML